MATDLITPTLTAILDDANAALTTPVDRYYLASGEVAWDPSCKGTLWVRTRRIVPWVANVPARGSVAPRCGVLGWQLEIGVGILRCAPTLDSRGRSPRAADLTLSSVAVHQDSQDLVSSLLCNGRVGAIVEWAPLGPDGGLVGGEWVAQLRLDVCPEC